MFRKISQEALTVFVTTVLTVLIWVYAESENIRARDISLELQLVAPPARLLVITDRADSPKVTVSARGATSQLARLQKLAESKFRLEVADDPGNLRQVLNLRERLEADDRIRGLNIRIDRVDPARREVDVERLESRTVPLVVIPGNMELAGAPTLERDKVTLSAPASSWRYVGDTVSAEIRLDPAEIGLVPEKVPQTRDLTVRPPAALRGPNVTIEPAKVKVTFTVSPRTAKYTAEAIPILLVLTPEVSKSYVVTLKDGLLAVGPVELEGPREAVELIKNKQQGVWALLRLTGDDLAKGITSKQVEFLLPPRVEVTSPLPTVLFTVEKRTPPPGPAPPPP